MDPRETFLSITNQIFNTWTALLLSINNGDHTVKEKAEWFPTAIVDWILNEKNPKEIYTDDIQHCLEEILNEEFDTVAEDNSTQEVAALLHKFFHLIFIDKNLAQVGLEVNNLPKKSGIGFSQPEGPASDFEEDGEEASQSSRKTSNFDKMANAGVVDEDGFTMVGGTVASAASTSSNSNTANKGPKLSKKQIEKLAKQNELLGDIDVFEQNRGDSFRVVTTVDDGDGNNIAEEGDWEMS